MKKALLLIPIFAIILVFANLKDEPNKEIDTLTIGFAPTVDPEKIISGTEDLENLLITQLGNFGYNVKHIEINVMTSYSAAAESLLSGSSLVAYMPTTTFALAQDETIVPFLEGLRYAQNVDSENPKDWNDNSPNYWLEDQMTSKFYSQFVTGPSDYGVELKNKFVENGFLTWEELNKANICFGSNATSSATYIYPAMWLYNNYGVLVEDISKLVPSNNSTEMTANLAMETCDVAPISSMSRITYADQWQSEWERTKSIWEETYVIGVSQPITNGMFGISTVNEYYSKDLKDKLEQAFITIASTEKGIEILNSINLVGVKKVSDDYLDNTYESLQFVEDKLK